MPAKEWALFNIKHLHGWRMAMAKIEGGQSS
jgi:hypothetical protein